MSARALRQHCLIDINEPTDSKTIKLLLSKLSNDQLVTLAKHIKSIRTLSMGSACSGSGIAAVTTKCLFEILGVGSVYDAYACELAASLVVGAQAACREAAPRHRP
eukprot:11560121-Alexandrium_andersonii.AAC.1